MVKLLGPAGIVISTSIYLIGTRDIIIEADRHCTQLLQTSKSRGYTPQGSKVDFKKAPYSAHVCPTRSLLLTVPPPPRPPPFHSPHTPSLLPLAAFSALVCTWFVTQVFCRAWMMAAAAQTSNADRPPASASPAVSPPPPGAAVSSYLKSYPYLFVRETDQTDYFCTVCESSLKEEDLQCHLFDGHSAENLQVSHDCHLSI